MAFLCTIICINTKQNKHWPNLYRCRRGYGTAISPIYLSSTWNRDARNWVVMIMLLPAAQRGGGGEGGEGRPPTVVKLNVIQTSLPRPKASSSQYPTRARTLNNCCVHGHLGDKSARLDTQQVHIYTFIKLNSSYFFVHLQKYISGSLIY